MSGTVGLAEQLVSELVDSGATAVALTGSYARGDPTTNSDLDLMIVGEGQSNLTVRVGVLVAQSWASEDEYRGRFLDPLRSGRPFRAGDRRSCFTIPRDAPGF